MGDNGKLYPAFNNDYVAAMRRLIKEADIIIPNLTEAAFLADMPYKEEYDEQYILSILKKLKSMGPKTVVLTGARYEKDTIGVAIYDDNGYQYFKHQLLPVSFHGTGDVYTSAFLGSYLSNRDILKASKVAASFVVKAIENTMDDPDHRYGVKFEPILAEFVAENK